MDRKIFKIIFISVIAFCVAGCLAGGIVGAGIIKIVKAVRAQEELGLLKQGILETGVEEDILSDWDMLQMAIVKTESDFRPEVSGGSAGGILQVTPIMVREVNRLLGDSVYSYKDRFDIEKSLEIFAIIQGKYNKDSLHLKAIKLWNPGGESINYSSKVFKNLEFVKRYERVRKALLNKKA